MVARIRPYLAGMRGAQAAVAVPRRSPRYWSFSYGLRDGARTRAYVAAYPQANTRVRIELMDPPAPLASWCADTGTANALVGGFFVREHGTPLGDLWIDGTRAATVPFDEPWRATRSCVSIDGERLTLASRDELPERPS